MLSSAIVIICCLSSDDYRRRHMFVTSVHCDKTTATRITMILPKVGQCPFTSSLIRLTTKFEGSPLALGAQTIDERNVSLEMKKTLKTLIT